MEQPSSNELVEHLFRHEHGKIMAILTRIFGLQHLEMIEDVVQDTFIKAIAAWREEIPAQPTAWLMRVAKNRAIDILRRDTRAREKIGQQITQGPMVTQIDQLFLDNEIKDSQLRLIFACSHPLLKIHDQIALNLQIVSGFSRKEIARALLSNEATIKKRLHRARRFIKENGIEFTIPVGAELKDRLHAVQTVLYLIFNEGYHSIHPDELIRKDLCVEAMRLCKLLCEHTAIEHSTSFALMALMCFHAARFESRLDTNGQIILLKDQDRSLWKKELISIGTHYYRKAWHNREYSDYHIEAAIALEHIVAKDFQSTDWERIYKLYEWLEKLKGSPIIQLNKAIVLIEMNNSQLAFDILQEIPVKKLGNRQHLYYAALAEACLLQNDYVSALNYLSTAQEISPTDQERFLLNRKIIAVNSLSN